MHLEGRMSQEELVRIDAELSRLESLLKGKSETQNASIEGDGTATSETQEGKTSKGVSIVVTDHSGEGMQVRAAWITPHEDPIADIRLVNQEKELERIEREIKVLEGQVVDDDSSHAQKE